MPFITRVKNRNVTDLLDKEKFIKSFIEKGDEICAYERAPVTSNLSDYFLLEVKFS